MERYERIRVIGQGAFGKVYLVSSRSDGRLLVTKEIPVDDLGTGERQSALNEVKVLKILKHPNIVAYHDNFVEEKKLVIVMEYAPGGTLHDFIQERNGSLLDEDLVLQFFAQMLVAIDHVHTLNILHRDLKTQNVMMNKHKSVLKIGDFGISKVLSSKITSAKTVVGTPCYISPEICEGKLYAKKSDIWALGCILYELTTLNKAFEGPNLPALVLKIMQASASLKPIDSCYSSGLDNLIHSMLQKTPEDRPVIPSVMATPVVVNALLNLCTDVGRLPCSRYSKSSSEEVKTPGLTSSQPTLTYKRMGSLGKYRQTSFFTHDGSTKQGNDTQVKGPPKPVVYLWGGGSSVPMRLTVPINLTDSPIVGVACGQSQRAGVTEDGKLIFWELVSGSLMTTRFTMTKTRAPKLGGGRGPLLFEPRLIGGLKSTVIKKVACGDMFTACLTDKGILMTFGCGVNGCLGHGDSNDVKEPRLVHEMLAHETTEIACGANHMMAITSEGQLYSWGKGHSGQLGLGECVDQWTPVRVQLPPDDPPVRAACGMDCSLVLTQSGKLLASGNNKFNKLSLDEPYTAPPEKSCDTAGPQDSGQVTQGNPVLANLIKSQPNSLIMGSLVLSTMKTQQLSGASKSGPTPSPAHPGTVKSSAMFRQSGSPLVNSETIVRAAIGINHTAMITASDQCITCGDNHYGQLGYHSNQDQSPHPVTSLTGKLMELVTCGDFYTTVVCKGGLVYSWGCSRRSRLGRECADNVIEPALVPFEHHSHTVGTVCSSHGVTLLLTTPES